MELGHEAQPGDVFTVVLAGGRGTRLGALTHGCAKPAVSFGGQYRLIDFSLSNAFNAGLRRMAVVTQHSAHGLIDHLRRGWNFLHPSRDESLEVWPAQPGPRGLGYVGTADAVWQNLAAIGRHRPRHVLVLAGDHVYRMDYRAMLRDHVRSGAAVTVACTEVPIADAHRFGVVVTDGARRMVGFQEKPATPRGLPDRPSRAAASMGIYVFDFDVLARLLERDARRAGSSHDFGHDVIPDALASVPVLAHRFVTAEGDPAYWRDVGTVDAYFEASLALLGARPPLDLTDRCWPLRTRTEPAPPAVVRPDGDLPGRVEQCLLAPGSAVLGASIRRSVLSEGARVGAGSNLAETILLPGARVGRGCLLRRVVVEEGCEVPDGLAVGLDPLADAARFGCSAGGIAVVTGERLAALGAGSSRDGARAGDGRFLAAG